MCCLLLQCPVVLRLVFHDSGTHNSAARNGGSNASIQFELDRPENFGLKRGWKVIQQAMSNIQGTAAEGVVSHADMIALVGAYAVGLCGGPLISVPVGQSSCSCCTLSLMVSESSGQDTLLVSSALFAFRKGLLGVGPGLWSSYY